MCVHMQDHKMRTEDANHLRDAIDAADATDAMMQSCNHVCVCLGAGCDHVMCPPCAYLGAGAIDAIKCLAIDAIKCLVSSIKCLVS